MPLVFAGVFPSCPALIPELRAPEADLSVLDTARSTFEQELYLAKPEIVLLLSPSVGSLANTVTLQASPQLTATYEQFGDFSFSYTWAGSPQTAAKLSHDSYHAHLPVKLDSSTNQLDSESVIATTCIARHLEHTHILPIGSTLTDTDSQVALGTLLYNHTMDNPKRIAIIALGHLAATQKDSQDEAALFDAHIRDLLRSGNYEALQHIDSAEAMRHNCSLYAPLLTLSAIGAARGASYEEFAYQPYAGIGYTIGTLNIS